MIPAGVRAFLAAPARARTYRRGVFFLLGALVALPYLLLGGIFATLLQDRSVPRELVALLLLAATGIAGLPTLLGGVRALEIAAVRALLEADLPQPGPVGRLAWETRLRGALWVGLHVVSGALLVTGLLSLLPMALVTIAGELGFGTEALRGDGFSWSGGLAPGWALLLGVGMLLLLLYGTAAMGAAAAVMAPVLLGPSGAERIAALEAQGHRLAERNRLARELHDSVGHAFTVTTLQAAAAREVLTRDPEFAGRALAVIEETGRAAMAELDHLLGVLRDDETGRSRASTAPPRRLTDVAGLVADSTAPVALDTHGDLDRLPAAVSREGYRIVQEALTNAARHGTGGPVRVRLDADPERVLVEVRNPAAPRHAERAAPPRAGHGLAGLRERTLLLGGSFQAGPDGSDWLLTARLPRRARG